MSLSFCSSIWRAAGEESVSILVRVVLWAARPMYSGLVCSCRSELG